MKRIYTKFNENGAVKGYFTCYDEDALPILPNGWIAREGQIDADYILVGDETVKKPESSITISTSGITATTGEVVLSYIPSSGARIRITGNGQSFYRNVTDKSYEFLLDTPGNYVVQCESDVQLPITFNLRVA